MGEFSHVSRMSFSAAYAWLAQQKPDRPAITHAGESITRKEFDRRSNRLARAYSELGVQENDLVTVALPNSIEAYLAYAAIWKLGATPQPISARLPALEREAIINLVDPSLVVGAEASDRAWVPARFEAACDLSDGALPDKAAKHWKAPTSGGSTGRPKIIVAAQSAHIDPQQVSRGFGQRCDGVQLVPGPLYHNAPFAFSNQALLTGNHLVVMSRFDAEEALRLIEQYAVDWMLMVPTMMQRIWRLGESVRARYDLSSLNALLHLAAPCPEWLKAAWIDWLGAEKIWELYAGTEAQGVTTIRGDDWLTHRGSVGKPEPGTMRVLNASGVDAAAGEIGEIYMRPRGGAGSTYHYIGAEAKRREGGWESLGDMGRIDADGYLYLADRSADMILSGGANIYPAEVEAALDAHPAIRSSCVIGLPDEDLGNRVHAILDAPGHTLETWEVLEFLKDRLARYKHPRSMEFVDGPVRDDAGKVRRSQLRQDRLKHNPP